MILPWYLPWELGIGFKPPICENIGTSIFVDLFVIFLKLSLPSFFFFFFEM